MEEELNYFPSTSIDGKQIIWNSHMKTESLKRREHLPPAASLRLKTKYEIPVEYRHEEKQIGIVKPLLTLNNENHQWNCSELEKLQRRFSELIDGKYPDDESPSPINENLLIERIQSLYASMGSHIYVSPSLVRLFLLTDLQVCSLEQWKLLHRGYPIWLYNTGLNPRRTSELRLIIVDEKTGFILWSDRINSISNILQPTHCTLAFRHSSNRSSIMLRFETIDEKFFTRFYSYFKQNQYHLEHQSSKKCSKRLIKKSDISPPCHFKHFNHIENLTNSHPILPS